MKKWFYILILTLITTSIAQIYADTKKNEAYYQKLAAKDFTDAKVEHILEDKTRVDILTDKEAIEVDWAYKWAEGVGQALYYSTMTGKEAGLILIIKEDKDMRYVKRVQKIILIKSLKINLYIMQNEKLVRIE